MPSSYEAMKTCKHYFDQLGLDPSNWVKLVKAYGDRGYHNFDHLETIFAQLACRVPGTCTPAMALAILYHDIDENEQKSISMMIEAAQSKRPDLVPEAAYLIYVTQHFLVEPGCRASRLLVDADLSILGASEEEFRDYENGIRQEYAHVHLRDFTLARRKIYAKLLMRDKIFRTPEFSCREKNARLNIRSAINRLHFHLSGKNDGDINNA